MRLEPMQRCILTPWQLPTGYLVDAESRAAEAYSKATELLCDVTDNG